MFRYLPLILKNCWRNRRRTVLTILSIALSMCLLGVMLALYHAFYLRAAAPEEARRLVVRNRISLTVTLPAFYAARIRQVPGVQEVMVDQWFNGTYKDARDPNNFFARMAIEPDKLFRVYPEYRIPEDQKQAFLRERTACLVGRELANKFHFQPGDRLNLVGDIYPGNFEFTVRGIFDSPRSSDILYFNNEYLEQSLPEARRGQVGAFYVVVDRPDSASRVAAAIDGVFHNATVQTKTETEQAFVIGFLALLGNVKAMLLGISAAVMFTILLVSANTMAMSTRERVHEVGVLKTLGFTPAVILSLILGEACLISMAGGAVGYLISMTLTGGIRKSPYGGMLPPVKTFETSVALTCIFTACVIGLISSLVPALNASRTSIVTALRSEE
ncbi:MAG TPA: FtsX-like permease family protein [Bryobacteraceae bacterium]|nr:FtsX-like permease family protein [Bryobacteraceae bacterium]